MVGCWSPSVMEVWSRDRECVCVCVCGPSHQVSSGVVQTHVYSIYSAYRHKHTQIQMQILEVTQHSDRVGRDLIKNGEARVIKYHLNPPTSCDPAISHTPGQPHTP